MIYLKNSGASINSRVKINGTMICDRRFLKTWNRVAAHNRLNIPSPYRCAQARPWYLDLKRSVHFPWDASFLIPRVVSNCPPKVKDYPRVILPEKPVLRMCYDDFVYEMIH